MREESTPNKQCTGCKRRLPLDQFAVFIRRSGWKDRKSSCVECCAKWQSTYRPDLPDPNPSGLCLCGCGEVTRIASVSSRKEGKVKGKHLRYIPGHQRRKSANPYRVEDRGYATPCWIWMRATSRHGYGCTTVNTKRRPAHCVYFEDRFGPIPEGYEIDHLCRVKACVNPDHLEAVTHWENLRRARES